MERHRGVAQKYCFISPALHNSKSVHMKPDNQVAVCTTIVWVSDQARNWIQDWWLIHCFYPSNKTFHRCCGWEVTCQIPGISRTLETNVLCDLVKRVYKWTSSTIAATPIWCIKRSEIGWAATRFPILSNDALSSSKLAFSHGSVNFWIATWNICFFLVRRIAVFLDFCLWPSQRNFPVTRIFLMVKQVPVLPTHHILFSLNYWEQTKSRPINLPENRETFVV